MVEFQGEGLQANKKDGIQHEQDDRGSSLALEWKHLYITCLESSLHHAAVLKSKCQKFHYCFT